MRTGIAVLAVALFAGCSSVRVTDSYKVPAGQPVGLVAPSNSAARVMGVELDTSKIDFGTKPEVNAQAIGSFTGKVYLIYGAERVK